MRVRRGLRGGSGSFGGFTGHLDGFEWFVHGVEYKNILKLLSSTIVRVKRSVRRENKNSSGVMSIYLDFEGRRVVLLSREYDLKPTNYK